MPTPTGFGCSARQNGEIAITRDGRLVTVLRGRTAERLGERLAAASDDSEQHLLARATGNYRRGNERR